MTHIQLNLVESDPEVVGIIHSVGSSGLRNSYVIERNARYVRGKVEGKFAALESKLGKIV